MNQSGGILNSLRPSADALDTSGVYTAGNKQAFGGLNEPQGVQRGPAFNSYLADQSGPQTARQHDEAAARRQQVDREDAARLARDAARDEQQRKADLRAAEERTAERRERDAASRDERLSREQEQRRQSDERVARDQVAQQERAADRRETADSRKAAEGDAADQAKQSAESAQAKAEQAGDESAETADRSVEAAVRRIVRRQGDDGGEAQSAEPTNSNTAGQARVAAADGDGDVAVSIQEADAALLAVNRTEAEPTGMFLRAAGMVGEAAAGTGGRTRKAAAEKGDSLKLNAQGRAADQLNGLQANETAQDPGKAAGLKEFLRKLGGAVDREAQQNARPEASTGAEAAKSKSQEAAVDSARRLELDAAKWQIHGRAYGERASKGESTEQRLSELVDRYAVAKKEARAANRSDSGGAKGEQHQQQNSGRSNELQSIQGGDFRDVNSREALDLGRQKEEFVRENRKLFNELVEKARVNVQSNGNSSASIRMNPAALGRMTLNLNVQQNQVHARILVETDAARRLVMDEMDHLRSELSRQGISVESLSVRVREPASMSFMDGTNQQDRNSQSTLEQGAGQNHSDRRAPEDEQARVPGSLQREQGAEEYERGVPDAISGATVAAAAAGGVNISI